MFGLPIILYLFLGGAGAGACLVLAVVGLLVPSELTARPKRLRGGTGTVFAASGSYRGLFVPAYACALVVLLLGMVCLIADLGRADRLLLLLTVPSLSHIAVGAYAYAACFVLTVMLALVWTGVVRNVPVGLARAFEVLSVPVALVSMVYTGLLLQSLAAVPLWTVPWLPVIFVLSSVSCGIALVVGVAHFGEAGSMFPSLFKRLIACDVIVIVLEAAAVAAFLVACASAIGAEPSGTAKAAIGSYRELVAGSNAGLLWVGFVGVGLVLPFALEAVALLCAKVSSRGLALAISACVLFGGFVMRFCIVEAGMHPVLALAAGG
ncbi:NrfD/PsrC family molybdoenzyme membrane anchor subunit [Raoultibacter phocaeensis]|uniref:NrfD/PsrC family molybdoenzyme membrane anchor subunit n=1 Tax=Raoultibacter phocaeensis TaxID=2479841 RepID=UPI002101F003|nr:NrfD/PsrC family molybdoenzyme membrane anchor subunit [Raoultibacter phocaeensis]